MKQLKAAPGVSYLPVEILYPGIAFFECLGYLPEFPDPVFNLITFRHSVPETFVQGGRGDRNKSAVMIRLAQTGVQSKKSPVYFGDFLLHFRYVIRCCHGTSPSLSFTNSIIFSGFLTKEDKAVYPETGNE